MAGLKISPVKWLITRLLGMIWFVFVVILVWIVITKFLHTRLDCNHQVFAVFTEIIDHKVSSKTHLAPYNFKPLFVQFHPPNKRKLPYFLLRRHNSHCEVRGGHFLSATTAPTNRPGHCCTTNNLQLHQEVRNTYTYTARSWSWYTSNSANLRWTRSRKLTRRAADIHTQMWWTAQAVRSRPNVS